MTCPAWTYDTNPSTGEPVRTQCILAEGHTDLHEDGCISFKRCWDISDTVDYTELDPGIRETVRFLRQNNFDTTDSGDGSKASEMECAESEPNAYMVVDNPRNLVSEAVRLRTVLVGRFGNKVRAQMSIEASFSPLDDVALIALHGLSDKDF